MLGRVLDGLVVYVGIAHLGFLTLEMFFWRRPLGLKIFKMSQQTADLSAVLAANQGLYNGFLALGLFWSVLARDPAQALSLKVFFLSCVLVAGVYGGLTASKGILVVQALPATVALIVLGASLS